MCVNVHLTTGLQGELGNWAGDGGIQAGVAWVCNFYRIALVPYADTEENDVVPAPYQTQTLALPNIPR